MAHALGQRADGPKLTGVALVDTAPGLQTLAISVTNKVFVVEFEALESIQDTIGKLYSLSIQMQRHLEGERNATQADAGAGRHEP